MAADKFAIGHSRRKPWLDFRHFPFSGKACCAILTPVVTPLPASLINFSMSLAEIADRFASALTSPATTANPRPCSPPELLQSIKSQQVGLVSDFANDADNPSICSLKTEIVSMASTAMRTTLASSSAFIIKSWLKADTSPRVLRTGHAWQLSYTAGMMNLL